MGALLAPALWTALGVLGTVFVAVVFSIVYRRYQRLQARRAATTNGNTRLRQATKATSFGYVRRALLAGYELLMVIVTGVVSIYGQLSGQRVFSTPVLAAVFAYAVISIVGAIVLNQYLDLLLVLKIQRLRDNGLVPKGGAL